MRSVMLGIMKGVYSRKKLWRKMLKEHFLKRFIYFIYIEREIERGCAGAQA